jgi:UDP-glucose 4-epimerase
VKVLVTGGLGLIGSEVADKAAEAGWVVHVVDDCTANVVPRVERAWGCDYASIEKVAAEWPSLHGREPAPDVIVHCAAPVGPVGILGRHVLDDCASSTRAAIDVARRTGAALVVLSSSEVYGTVNPQGALVVPDDWSHRTEYAVGKVVTEQLARRHHAETGLPTMVVRPWNVTGPRQAAGKGFVFPRMAGQAVLGRPVTVYRPGTQRRAFMAVTDFADQLVRLMDAPRDGAPWDAAPIDAANPANDVSMNHLARLFTAHHLSRTREWTSIDPRSEHGPAFREAAAGSKLPMREPVIRGTTPLEVMVDVAMRHAAGRVEGLLAA